MFPVDAIDYFKSAIRADTEDEHFDLVSRACKKINQCIIDE